MKIAPDGRWSWLICAGCTLWNIVIGGNTKISGILFVEYMDLFNTGAAATSLITLTRGLLKLVLAPVGGYLADKMPFHKLRVMLVVLYTLAAACVAVSGYMPSLPLTVLTYGVLLGLCVGLVDPVVLVLPSHYFIKKRNFAYGISFTGNSFGALLFPLFFIVSFDYVGFRGAMLIFSGIWLQCLLIPALSWPLDTVSTVPTFESKALGGSTNIESERSELNMDSISIEVKTDRSNCSDQDTYMIETFPDPETRRLSSERSGIISGKPEAQTTRCPACCQVVLKVFEEYKSLLATPKLPYLMMALLFGFTGYYNSFFILPPLAKELGLSKLETSTILVTASVVEIVSKLVVGFIVDRCNVPKFTLLLASYAVTGTAGLIVSFIPNAYACYGYGAVLGAFGGCVLGISIPMLIEEVGQEKKGIAAGMCPLLIGISNTIGPAILGSIAQISGSYVLCLTACACAYLLGILCYLGKFCSLNTCKQGVDRQNQLHETRQVQ